MRLLLLEVNAANVALFQEVLVQAGPKAGFTPYLTKPIGPKALREALRTLAGARR